MSDLGGEFLVHSFSGELEEVRLVVRHPDDEKVGSLAFLIIGVWTYEFRGVVDFCANELGPDLFDLEIWDVRSRQWEGKPLHVFDEDDPDRLHFYCKSFIRTTLAAATEETVDH